MSYTHTMSTGGTIDLPDASMEELVSLRWFKYNPEPARKSLG
jgi:hypothetical protein